MKIKKQQQIINLMYNKVGDQKLNSLHEKTEENKLEGTTLMDTKMELRRELSIIPDKISEGANLSVRKRRWGVGRD